MTVAVTMVVALACGCAEAGPAAPAGAAQSTNIDTNTPQGLRAKQVMDMLNSDWPIGPVGVRTLAAADKVDDVGTKMDKIWWDRPFTLTGVDIGAGQATLHVLTSYAVAQDIELRTNDVGDITTSFGESTYDAYVDSGSNGLYFLDSPTTGIPTCRKPDDSFYCPHSAATLTATNHGFGGTTTSITFEVDNATQLFSTTASAFPGLAGPSANTFDWGLPFFYGRTVFTAIENQSTAGGLGPYVAY
jgi:hypothetical protein